MTYKHTLTLRGDSRFLRFYLWLWAADVEQVDFCRLFWGYAFAWVALLARPIIGLGWLIALPFRALHHFGDRRGWWDKPEPTPPPPPRRPAPKADTPGKLAEFFARSGVRRCFKLFGIALLLVGALLAVVGFAALARIVAPVVWTFFASGEVLDVASAVGSAVWTAITSHVALLVVSSLAGLALAVGVLFAADRFAQTDAGQRFGKRAVRFGERVGRFFVRVGQFVALAFYALKTNTCPKVEVRK